jgi:long-chain fatty acid transport protein
MQSSKRARKGPPVVRVQVGVIGALVAALAGSLCVGRNAYATDGYLAIGYGTQSKGAAGSGLADPKEALAIANNPAAAFAMGNRADVDLDFMRPDRHASITDNAFGPDRTYNGNGAGLSLIPGFAVTRGVNEDLALGLAIYSGGVATDYKLNPFARFGATGGAGVKLAQVLVSPTAAYEVAPGHTLGVALDVSGQQFKAYGIQPFASASVDPDHFSNLGSTIVWGYGIKFGYLGQLTPRFSVGAFYQSRTRSEKFEKYSGLFVDGGAFDIPASYGLGFAFKAADQLDVTADVHRIMYGEIPSLANPLSPLLAGHPFGSADGPGFGWHDITAIKIGVNYAINSTWQVRAGWGRSENPIPSSQTLLNILAPAVVKNQFTLGATWTAPSGYQVSGYLLQAPRTTVSGSGSIPDRFGGGEASISLGETVVGIGFGWKF